MGLAMKVKHFYLCFLHNRECIGHLFVVDPGEGYRKMQGLRFYNPDKVFWNV